MINQLEKSAEAMKIMVLEKTAQSTMHTKFENSQYNTQATDEKEKVKTTTNKRTGAMERQVD